MPLGQADLKVYLDGSRFGVDEIPDPRMERYGMSPYTQDSGVEMVIKNLEQARIKANAFDSRLRHYFLDICKTYDMALAANAAPQRIQDFRQQQAEDIMNVQRYEEMKAAGDPAAAAYRMNRQYDNKGYA